MNEMWLWEGKAAVSFFMQCPSSYTIVDLLTQSYNKNATADEEVMDSVASVSNIPAKASSWKAWYQACGVWGQQQKSQQVKTSEKLNHCGEVYP